MKHTESPTILGKIVHANLCEHLIPLGTTIDDYLAQLTGEQLEDVVIIDPDIYSYMLISVYVGLLADLPPGDFRKFKQAIDEVYREFVGHMYYKPSPDCDIRRIEEKSFKQCRSIAERLVSGFTTPDANGRSTALLPKERSIVMSAAYVNYMFRSDIDVGLAYAEALDKLHSFYAKIECALAPEKEATKGHRVNEVLVAQLAIERISRHLFNGLLEETMTPLVIASIQRASKAGSLQLLPRHKHPVVSVIIGPTGAGKSTWLLHEAERAGKTATIKQDNTLLTDGRIASLVRDRFRPLCCIYPGRESLLEQDRTEYIERTNAESRWYRKKLEALATRVYFREQSCPILCYEFVAPAEEDENYYVDAFERFPSAQLTQIDIPLGEAVKRSEKRTEDPGPEGTPYRDVDLGRAFPLTEIIRTHRNAGYWARIFRQRKDGTVHPPFCTHNKSQAFGQGAYKPFWIVSNDVPKDSSMKALLLYDFSLKEAAIYDLQQLLSLSRKKHLRRDLTEADRQDILDDMPSIYEPEFRELAANVDDMIPLLKNSRSITFYDSGNPYAVIRVDESIQITYDPQNELTQSEEFQAILALVQPIAPVAQTSAKRIEDLILTQNCRMTKQKCLQECNAQEKP